MRQHCFVVKEEFSKWPAGRYESHGPNSGEVFRGIVNLLLAMHDEVFIDFAGIMGVPASFIEEAFGGLVRECGWTRSELLTRLQFLSTLDQEDKMWEAIEDAQNVKEWGLAQVV